MLTAVMVVIICIAAMMITVVTKLTNHCKQNNMHKSPIHTSCINSSPAIQACADWCKRQISLSRRVCTTSRTAPSTRTAAEAQASPPPTPCAPGLVSCATRTRHRHIGHPTYRRHARGGSPRGTRLTEPGSSLRQRFRQ